MRRAAVLFLGVLLMAAVMSGCFGSKKRSSDDPAQNEDGLPGTPGVGADGGTGVPRTTAGNPAERPPSPPEDGLARLMENTARVGPNDILELNAVNYSMFRVEFTEDTKGLTLGSSLPIGLVAYREDDAPGRTGSCGTLEGTRMTYAMPGYSFDALKPMKAGVYRFVLGGEDALFRITFGDGSGQTVQANGVELDWRITYVDEPVWEDAKGAGPSDSFTLSVSTQLPSYVMFDAHARPNEGSGENRFTAALQSPAGGDCISLVNESVFSVAIPDQGTFLPATWLWGNAWTNEVGTHTWTGRYEWDRAADFYRGIDVIVLPMPPF